MTKKKQYWTSNEASYSLNETHIRVFWDDSFMISAYSENLTLKVTTWKQFVGCRKGFILIKPKLLWLLKVDICLFI